jgi:hypothetical protein
VAFTIEQLVADVPNGLTLTPPQETKKKVKQEASKKQAASGTNLQELLKVNITNFMKILPVKESLPII